MSEKSDVCPYLQADESNKKYICKARIHYKELTPHIAKLCKSELYETCPDYRFAEGKVIL